MNGYSLVIDISSDEENVRYSTLLKTLPVNMVGNLCYSLIEAWCGSDPDLNSTFESGCSPEKKKTEPEGKEREGNV